MSLVRTTRALLSGGLEGKAVGRPASAEPRPALYGPAGIERRLTQRSVKTHLSTYGGGASGYASGFGEANAVDWVSDAVDYWAGAAAGAAYHFEKQGKRMRVSTDDPSADEYPGGLVPSSLEGLLRQPNPFQTFDELRWLLTTDLLLVGNAYWLKYKMDSEGRPLAIYRLNPAFIEAVPGATRPVDQYLYHVEGVNEPIPYSPDEVVHFKLPNPNSNIYGVGVIARGPRVYDQDLALVETMAQFFEQGAKLSGVLQSDRSVPEPILKKVQRQFASLYSGSHNAYKVAVLERGLTFQSIQPTAAEAQFESLTKLGRDRIFAMFGMHPSLISADAARPGLLDEAQRHFDNKRMRPFLNKLQGLISSELTQAWGVDLVIDYAYVLPEKDRLTLAAVFSALPGVKVREVREYVDLPPLGDERDEIVLNMPGIGVEAGGSPMGAVPGPAGGRPANPNNMGGAPAPDGATKPDARYSRAQARKALEDPEALLEELAHGS